MEKALLLFASEFRDTCRTTKFKKEAPKPIIAHEAFAVFREQLVVSPVQNVALSLDISAMFAAA